ncbi:unnamed protein product, partial [Ectocarpus sp. 6 AP-2014]
HVTHDTHVGGLFGEMPIDTLLVCASPVASHHYRAKFGDGGHKIGIWHHTRGSLDTTPGPPSNTSRYAFSTRQRPTRKSTSALVVARTKCSYNVSGKCRLDRLVCYCFDAQSKTEC